MSSPTLTLEEVIRTSPVIVHPSRYTYLKCQEIPPVSSGSHFLISTDADEVTVVTKEENLAGVPCLASEGWFKLFEIKVSQPFVAKGFLSTITNAIAEEKINILVVSTFSKDYLLMREPTYEKAVAALKRVGFSVEEK